MKKFLLIFLLLVGNIANLSAKETNQGFGEWLVSCKENLMTAKNDCFIGTSFENEAGRGALVLTKYYMAIAHNEANLNQGASMQVDNGKQVTSFMNTGVSVFFKNSDRKFFIEEMKKDSKLKIMLKGHGDVLKSLEGFSEAYKFYNQKISN